MSNINSANSGHVPSPPHVSGTSRYTPFRRNGVWQLLPTGSDAIATASWHSPQQISGSPSGSPNSSVGVVNTLKEGGKVDCASLTMNSNGLSSMTENGLSSAATPNSQQSASKAVLFQRQGALQQKREGKEEGSSNLVNHGAQDDMATNAFNGPSGGWRRHHRVTASSPPTTARAKPSPNTKDRGAAPVTPGPGRKAATEGEERSRVRGEGKRVRAVFSPPATTPIATVETAQNEEEDEGYSICSTTTTTATSCDSVKSHNGTKSLEKAETPSLPQPPRLSTSAVSGVAHDSTAVVVASEEATSTTDTRGFVTPVYVPRCSVSAVDLQQRGENPHNDDGEARRSDRSHHPSPSTSKSAPVWKDSETTAGGSSSHSSKEATLVEPAIAETTSPTADHRRPSLLSETLPPSTTAQPHTTTTTATLTDVSVSCAAAAAPHSEDVVQSALAPHSTAAAAGSSTTSKETASAKEKEGRQRSPQQNTEPKRCVPPPPSRSTAAIPTPSVKADHTHSSSRSHHTVSGLPPSAEPPLRPTADATVSLFSSSATSCSPNASFSHQRRSRRSGNQFGEPNHGESASGSQLQLRTPHPPANPEDSSHGHSKDSQRRDRRHYRPASGRGQPHPKQKHPQEETKVVDASSSPSDPHCVASPLPRPPSASTQHAAIPSAVVEVLPLNAKPLSGWGSMTRQAQRALLHRAFVGLGVKGDTGPRRVAIQRFLRLLHVFELTVDLRPFHGIEIDKNLDGTMMEEEFAWLLKAGFSGRSRRAPRFELLRCRVADGASLVDSNHNNNSELTTPRSGREQAAPNSCPVEGDDGGSFATVPSLGNSCYERSHSDFSGVPGPEYPLVGECSALTEVCQLLRQALCDRRRRSTRDALLLAPRGHHPHHTTTPRATSSTTTTSCTGGEGENDSVPVLWENGTCALSAPTRRVPHRPHEMVRSSSGVLLSRPTKGCYAHEPAPRMPLRRPTGLSEQRWMQLLHSPYFNLHFFSQMQQRRGRAQRGADRERTDSCPHSSASGSRGSASGTSSSLDGAAALHRQRTRDSSATVLWRGPRGAYQSVRAPYNMADLTQGVPARRPSELTEGCPERRHPPYISAAAAAATHRGSCRTDHQGQKEKRESARVSAPTSPPSPFSRLSLPEGLTRSTKKARNVVHPPEEPPITGGSSHPSCGRSAGQPRSQTASPHPAEHREKGGEDHHGDPKETVNGFVGTEESSPVVTGAVHCSCPASVAAASGLGESEAPRATPAEAATPHPPPSVEVDEVGRGRHARRAKPMTSEELEEELARLAEIIESCQEGIRTLHAIACPTAPASHPATAEGGLPPVQAPPNREHRSTPPPSPPLPPHVEGVTAEAAASAETVRESQKEGRPRPLSPATGTTDSSAGGGQRCRSHSASPALPPTPQATPKDDGLKNEKEGEKEEEAKSGGRRGLEPKAAVHEGATAVSCATTPAVAAGGSTVLPRPPSSVAVFSSEDAAARRCSPLSPSSDRSAEEKDAVPHHPFPLSTDAPLKAVSATVTDSSLPGVMPDAGGTEAESDSVGFVRCCSPLTAEPPILSSTAATLDLVEPSTPHSVILSCGTPPAKVSSTPPANDWADAPFPGANAFLDSLIKEKEKTAFQQQPPDTGTGCGGSGGSGENGGGPPPHCGTTSLMDAQSSGTHSLRADSPRPRPATRGCSPSPAAQAVQLRGSSQSPSTGNPRPSGGDSITDTSGPLDVSGPGSLTQWEGSASHRRPIHRTRSRAATNSFAVTSVSESPTSHLWVSKELPGGGVQSSLSPPLNIIPLSVFTTWLLQNRGRSTDFEPDESMKEGGGDGLCSADGREVTMTMKVSGTSFKTEEKGGCGSPSGADLPSMYFIPGMREDRDSMRAVAAASPVDRFSVSATGVPDPKMSTRSDASKFDWSPERSLS